MQILVTNDDGAKAYGLHALRRAAQMTWPTATIITLTTETPCGGQGMSVTCVDLDELQIQSLEPDVYVVKCRPADLVYLALGRAGRFLRTGCFDLVLCGVNHGQNVGMDIFHSGTVGMAMLASTFYGVPAIAFSQQLLNYGAHVASEDQSLLRHSEYVVGGFLQNLPLERGRCMNVNLPAKDPLGWKTCPVALHSRFRPHRSEERNLEGYDVTELERGYATISPLELRTISSSFS